VANATDTMPEAQLRAEREAQLRPDTDYHPSYEDLNDDSNAEVFAKEFGDHLRYDHARKRWLVWNEHWWKVDSDASVMRKATGLLKRRFTESWRIGNRKYTSFLQRSRNEKSLRSCLAIASSKTPIATDGKQWDSNPFLLGVNNGVVDLRTGDLREGKPEDAITKHSPVAFDPNAQCPRWMQFLAEVFVHPSGKTDYELIDFLHKAVGYSLTGSVIEEKWFFCKGLGANGKTTFLETIHKFVLGEDYSKQLPFDELTQKKFGHSHPVGLSHLEGSRFVVASEGAKQVAFDDQRLKLLTGGDTVPARGMRENFREFSPTFKVWLAANHSLEVNDRTDGFWRRIVVIPFNARFTNPDKSLKETLAREAAGILRWAIEGCIAWQKQGLALPKSLENLKAQYRRDTDAWLPFLNSRCEFAPDAFTPSIDIQEAIQNCMNQGLDIPEKPDTELWNGLKERNAVAEQRRCNGKMVRGWRGMRIVDPERAKYYAAPESEVLSYDDWLAYQSYEAYDQPADLNE
jgi:putative DNA primase/helicase